MYGMQSLFDMSMFEWPHTPGQTVSSRFWVYWAITLPLTLVVVIIWLAWTNKKDLQQFFQRASAVKQGADHWKADV